MSIGGRTFRAFRPSRYARQDEMEEESGLAKEANIEVYMQRAQAGQPLFDTGTVVQALSGRKPLPES
jgi:hypothetical protein